MTARQRYKSLIKMLIDRTRIRTIKQSELLILLGLISILAICGCISSSLNSTSPDYIKDVSAIKEGDGLKVYFILADKDGQETTSDGHFTMIISNDKGAKHSLTKNIIKSDFQKVKLGMGAFEHDDIVYMGRIPYSDMGRVPNADSGKVVVSFTTPDKRTLKGDTIVFF